LESLYESPPHLSPLWQFGIFFFLLSDYLFLSRDHVPLSLSLSRRSKCTFFFTGTPPTIALSLTPSWRIYSRTALSLPLAFSIRDSSSGNQGLCLIRSFFLVTKNWPVGGIIVWAGKKITLGCKFTLQRGHIFNSELT